jgi:hypothetical protein
MSLTQLSPSLFILFSDCAIFSFCRNGQPRLMSNQKVNMFPQLNNLVRTIWPSGQTQLLASHCFCFYFVGLPKYTVAAELYTCLQPASGLVCCLCWKTMLGSEGAHTSLWTVISLYTKLQGFLFQPLYNFTQTHLWVTYSGQTRGWSESTLILTNVRPAVYDVMPSWNLIGQNEDTLRHIKTHFVTS